MLFDDGGLVERRRRGRGQGGAKMEGVGGERSGKAGLEQNRGGGRPVVFRRPDGRPRRPWAKFAEFLAGTDEDSGVLDVGLAGVVDPELVLVVVVGGHAVGGGEAGGAVAGLEAAEAVGAAPGRPGQIAVEEAARRAPAQAGRRARAAERGPTVGDRRRRDGMLDGRHLQAELVLAARETGVRVSPLGGQAGGAADGRGAFVWGAREERGAGGGGDGVPCGLRMRVVVVHRAGAFEIGACDEGREGR